MLHDIYVIETRFRFVSLYMHPCTSKKLAKGFSFSGYLVFL